MSFLSRKLGRTETLVPPVLWRLGSDAPAPAVLSSSLAAGLNWIVVPHDTPPATVVALREAFGDRLSEWSVVVGVDMEALRLRVVAPFDEVLRTLGVKRCAAVLLENPTSAGVKSGWPFHRLGQLRDKGATSLFFVACGGVEDAEWIVDNTPAHAVVVGYSEPDQLASYRLLKLAADMGVAVVGAGTGDLIDVKLRSAEGALTTQLLPLPNDAGALERTLNDLRIPLTPAEREASWKAFATRVPEPAKPKGAHPPDFGT